MCIDHFILTYPTIPITLYMGISRVDHMYHITDEFEDYDENGRCQFVHLHLAQGNILRIHRIRKLYQQYPYHYSIRLHLM